MLLYIFVQHKTGIKTNHHVDNIQTKEHLFVPYKKYGV